MNKWWKKHTEYKEDRESLVLTVSFMILFVPAILGLLVVGIMKLIELRMVGLQIVIYIVGAVIGSYLIDKWIKRGK